MEPQLRAWRFVSHRPQAKEEEVVSSNDGHIGEIVLFGEVDFK